MTKQNVESCVLVTPNALIPSTRPKMKVMSMRSDEICSEHLCLFSNKPQLNLRDVFVLLIDLQLFKLTTLLDF